MTNTAVAALCIAISYLAGSIPSGLLFGKLITGRDVRDAGSGNIGAANVSRVAGVRVAVLVLAADVLKGCGPVILGRALGLDTTELALVAAAAVVGHDHSAFLKLKGGKGVATTLGVAVVLAPAPTIFAACIWLGALAIWRFSSLASLLALWALPILMAIFDQPSEYVILTVGLVLLALGTHRANIARLSSGSERRLGQTAL